MKPPVIAVTGINATENPSPGTGIARSLQEDNQLSCRIIGLAYDAMEPGLYMDWLFERCFLMPYPNSTPEVLIERLRQIQQQVGLDCVIPNFDLELPLYIKCAAELDSYLSTNTRTVCPPQ
jgi:carbamoyl-phosphate synthase large subunit